MLVNQKVSHQLCLIKTIYTIAHYFNHLWNLKIKFMKPDSVTFILTLFFH